MGRVFEWCVLGKIEASGHAPGLPGTARCVNLGYTHSHLCSAPGYLGLLGVWIGGTPRTSRPVDLGYTH